MQALACMGDKTARELLLTARFVETYRVDRSGEMQFHASDAHRLVNMPGVQVIAEGNGLAVLLW